jgi:PAS domain S-box-containing protein
MNFPPGSATSQGILKALHGGGEMGDRVRASDWSRTPLGPFETWPPCLRNALDMCLASPMPVLIWWGPDHVLLYNDAARPLLRDEHPLALGRAGRQSWPEVWDHVGPLLGQALTEGASARAEAGLFDFSISPIRDETGAAAGVFCPVVESPDCDACEHRIASENEAQLNLVLKASGMSVFVHDFATRRVRRAGFLEETFGPPRENDEKAFFERVHPDDRAAFRGKIAGLTPERPAYEAEYRLKVPGGEWRWLAELAEMRFDATGAPEQLSGVCMDITERKTAEAALRESRERLMLAQSAAGVAIWDWNVATNATSFSPEYYELFGLPPGIPHGYEDFLKLVHPADRARVDAAMRAALADESPYDCEYRILRGCDGAERWMVAKGKVVFADGNPVRALGVAYDITSRKQAEAALRESEARLRLALDAAQADIWESVPEADQLSALGGALALQGVPAGTMMSRERALAAIHPEDRQRVEAELARTLETGAPFKVEFRASVVEGPYRWLAAHAELRRVGGRTRVIGLVQDIAEQKRYEEALELADRRKDEFLATLAHELRNPLAPIRTAVHLLRKSAGMDRERTLAVMEMMDRQVHHLIRLVDDLLEVSRISCGKIELKMEPTDLAVVIEHAVDISRPLIEASGLELAVSLPRRPVLFDADPVRLTQVLANLLNNAAKYTEAGGRITLEAERERDRAVVSVSDTGLGIPADMLPRVFDLFTQIDHTLGRAQGGLGIGLALVRNLVQLHGGDVEARSEGTGRGSVFIVRLPLPPVSADETAHPRGASAAAPRSRRVLVIDDNRDAADSLALLLEALDANVRVAYDGPAGLAALPAFAPELVFLDLGMPGMDGYEAARRIRQQPDGRGLTLVALTGWGQEEARGRALDAGFDLHLTKPANPIDLKNILGSSDAR